MQHKSGKEYDPSAWAAQRRAAVEAANKLRLERKTGAGEAGDLSFSPELISRNPTRLSPGNGTLPVEMDQQQHHVNRNQSNNQQQRNQQSNHNQGGKPTVSTSLDQLATDSLDHFYAAEGSRIAGPGSDPLTTPPGKENFGGGRGNYPSMTNNTFIQGQQIIGNGVVGNSPTSDSLVQELRRQGANPSQDNRGSPFVSKFGQELYQEGLRDDDGSGNNFQGQGKPDLFAQAFPGQISQSPDVDAGIKTTGSGSGSRGRGRGRGRRRRDSDVSQQGPGGPGGGVEAVGFGMEASGIPIRPQPNSQGTYLGGGPSPYQQHNSQQGVGGGGGGGKEDGGGWDNTSQLDGRPAWATFDNNGQTDGGQRNNGGGQPMSGRKDTMNVNGNNMKQPAWVNSNDTGNNNNLHIKTGGPGSNLMRQHSLGEDYTQHELGSNGTHGTTSSMPRKASLSNLKARMQSREASRGGGSDNGSGGRRGDMRYSQSADGGGTSGEDIRNKRLGNRAQSSGAAPTQIQWGQPSSQQQQSSNSNSNHSHSQRPPQHQPSQKQQPKAGYRQMYLPPNQTTEFSNSDDNIGEGNNENSSSSFLGNENTSNHGKSQFLDTQPIQQQQEYEKTQQQRHDQYQRSQQQQNGYQNQPPQRGAPNGQQQNGYQNQPPQRGAPNGQQQNGYQNQPPQRGAPNGQQQNGYQNQPPQRGAPNGQQQNGYQNQQHMQDGNYQGNQRQNSHQNSFQQRPPQPKPSGPVDDQVVGGGHNEEDDDTQGGGGAKKVDYFAAMMEKAMAQGAFEGGAGAPVEDPYGQQNNEELVPCSTCDRRMTRKALVAHSKVHAHIPSLSIFIFDLYIKFKLMFQFVCFVFFSLTIKACGKGPRKKFDTQKARVKGTEAAEFVLKKGKKGAKAEANAKPVKKNKWKEESNAFRQAMQAARYKYERKRENERNEIGERDRNKSIDRLKD